MEKKIMHISVVVILLLCASCTSTSVDSSKETFSETMDKTNSTQTQTQTQIQTEPYISESDNDMTYDPSDDYKLFMDKTITTLPYDEAIQKTTSDDILYVFLGSHSFPDQSSTWTPFMINKRYSLDMLRRVDDTRMYSIHKMESGGLLYMYYLYDVLQCSVYISRSLSIADYEKIGVGSSIEDVKKIEPATIIYEKHYSEKTASFAQPILLRDGLLKLYYDNDEGGYKVRKKEFFEDFTEVLVFGEETLYYDCSILPEDYPH